MQIISGLSDNLEVDEQVPDSPCVEDAKKKYNRLLAV
jgi:hypothetical protein